MQVESVQGDARPSQHHGSLKFRKIRGFTVHKQKAEETETRRHVKIQVNSRGALRLTTHHFTISNSNPQATIVQQGIAQESDLSHLQNPDHTDRLPPEGDPRSILDTGPRQKTDSVSEKNRPLGRNSHIGQDFPLLTWSKLDREDYLSELLRLEGQCGVSDVCPGCKLQAAGFRCEDCFGLHMYCQECTVTRHSEHPLHRLRVRGNEHGCILLILVTGMEWQILWKKNIEGFGLDRATRSSHW